MENTSSTRHSNYVNWLGLGIILFLILAVIAVGMGAKNPKDFRSDASQEGVTDKAEDPNKLTKKDGLSEGFPEFPIPPNAKLVKSVKMVQATDKGGYTAHWEVTEPKGTTALVSWYIQALDDAGWELLQVPTDLEQAENFISGKKDGRMFAMEIEREANFEYEVVVDFPLTFE